MTIALFFVLLLLVQSAAAFCSAKHNNAPALFRRTVSSSSLNYKDDGKDDNDDASMTRRRRRISVPVIGPLPGRITLLPGSDMTLEAPTPMIWQSLEECVAQHQQHLTGDDESAFGVAAAPLVAVLDEYTAVASAGNAAAGRRYATLAAIVGISSSSKDDAATIIDTDDTRSFMESLRSKTTIRDGTVRLVGIGRAVITNFFYQTPASCSRVDEEGHLLDVPSNSNSIGSQFILYDDEECELDEDSDGDDDDDDDDRHDCDTVNHIVMASFQLVTDMSLNASPVHALAEMSTLASKINSLHEQRKELVKGIQAGKARLELADIDHDGIGALFAAKQRADQQVEEEKESSSSATTTEAPRSRLQTLENYGLGNTASSFSSIPAMTAAMLDKLKAYYSPAKRSSEEHYYEMYSFTAVTSLFPYLEAQHAAWAAKTTNTAERLQAIYEWMRSHVSALQEEAKAIKISLKNCGEECTDLW